MVFHRIVYCFFFLCARHFKNVNKTSFVIVS